MYSNGRQLGHVNHSVTNTMLPASSERGTGANPIVYRLGFSYAELVALETHCVTEFFARLIGDSVLY